MITIDSVVDGAIFEVMGVRCAGATGKRLADMGFVGGSRGTLIRRALLGGPVQVRLLGYDVAIRRSEARLVEVRLLESGERGHDAQDAL